MCLYVHNITRDRRFFSNQPIDIAKLSVSLHETAQGYTYEDQDEPGTASLNARGYRLVEVSRSHEPVPGRLSLLPGNRVAAFYPQRELAYDAEVLLDIDYDGDCRLSMSSILRRAIMVDLVTLIHL